MIIQIVILSWVAAIFVTADIQLHPTKVDDFQQMVQSVKKDVDAHLKVLADRNRYSNIGLTFVEETIDPPKSNDTVVRGTTPIHDSSKEISDYSSDRVEGYYGSVKGRPGLDFPDYTDIPKTSFTCMDKTKLPGFYADTDTGCQVFHVCWPDRRESFLCPMGTIFNQALLACDYFYNFNCSLASLYYEDNAHLEPDSSRSKNVPMISAPVQKTDSLIGRDPTTSVMFFVSEFMPIKAKIVVYPKTKKQRPKIAVSASIGQTNTESKSSRVAKHSRVPRSLEYESSSSDSAESFKGKIYIYHAWTALNNAVAEIQNDKSTAHLSLYAERIPKFLKYWFLMDETPVKINVEPGTKLYEYDTSAQKTAKDVQFIFRKFIEFIANFSYELDVREKESEDINHEISEYDELQDLRDTPLTNINPRFIKKPTATEIKFEEINKSLNLAKPRIRRATATLNSKKVSQEDPERIYPETKEALLKSYVELCKSKLS